MVVVVVVVVRKGDCSPSERGGGDGGKASASRCATVRALAASGGLGHRDVASRSDVAATGLPLPV